MILIVICPDFDPRSIEQVQGHYEEKCIIPVWYLSFLSRKKNPTSHSDLIYNMRVFHYLFPGSFRLVQCHWEKRE